MLCPKFILLRRRSDYTYEARRVRWGGFLLLVGRWMRYPLGERSGWLIV